MKRLLTAALTALALAVPAAADASDSTLRYYGVNTKAGDCSGMTIDEMVRAQNSKWGVRCLMDKRVADNAGGAYNAYYSTFYTLFGWGEDSARVLPIIGWTNSNGSWHRPADANERAALQDFAYAAVDALHWAATNRGMCCGKAPNTVEVWNEPNCMVQPAPGPGSCKWGGFSSLGDYKVNAFDPVFAGARARAGNINLVVGGLGFGTEDTNGFNDASNWVRVWEERGYGMASAFSVHPYGYTRPDTLRRDDTVFQSSARSNLEFYRTCAPSNRSVIVTEVGRRTDWPSSDTYAQRQQKQYDYLNDINNYQGWHARGIFNYLSIDQASTGVGSVGVLDVANNPKQAFGLWDFLGRQGQQWMGDLGANCVP